MARLGLTNNLFLCTQLVATFLVTSLELTHFCKIFVTHILDFIAVTSMTCLLIEFKNIHSKSVCCFYWTENDKKKSVKYTSVC